MLSVLQVAAEISGASAGHTGGTVMGLALLIVAVLLVLNCAALWSAYKDERDGP